MVFTHVVSINLQLTTPIQINGSDFTVCKWIVLLEATELLQMILTERNDSIPMIRRLPFLTFSPAKLAHLSLDLFPLIGEPACLLPQLENAHCSQGHGWLDSLASNDFLCGLG